MKSPRYSLIPLYNQYAILIVFYNQRRRLYNRRRRL